MANALAQVYKSSAETQKSLVSIDNTLAKIYDVQLKELQGDIKDSKQQEDLRKKAEQKRKRTLADKIADKKTPEEKKVEKKEEENLLQTIVGALAGGLRNITSGLQSIFSGGF